MNIEVIWKEYRTSLKAFLHKNVANPDDVDDLLQEVLIKTYKHLDSVKETHKVKSWLFQVANNAIIDFYRKQGRAKELTEGDLWYKESDTNVHQQLSQCILPFIQALPADEAQMLTEIEIEGMSQKDYAQSHDVKYSTLKSRVQRSRERLNDLFKECCDFSVDQQGGIVDFQRKKKRCNRC